MDMFDFLEEAGRALERASRRLGEEEKVCTRCGGKLPVDTRYVDVCPLGWGCGDSGRERYSGDGQD